jgi:hypothetical protein
MPKTLFWQKSKGSIFKVKQSSLNMAAPPGNNFNPNGRAKGTLNETTKKIREIFASILENRQEELENALNQLRDRDPKSFLEIYLKLSNKFVGDVSRTEITGVDGETLPPIQIIIPKPQDDGDLEKN